MKSAICIFASCNAGDTVRDWRCPLPTSIRSPLRCRSAEEAVDADRVTYACVLIRRTSTEPETQMEIELLTLSQVPGATHVEDVAGAITCLVIPDVLDENVTC